MVDKVRFENSVEVKGMDSEKKVIYLIPFDPNTAVARDMRTGKPCKPSKDAIVKCAHAFNQRKVKAIGIDHKRFTNAALVENFIAHNGYKFPNGMKADKGAWVAGVQLTDELWQFAKSGGIKGVSPAGYYDADKDELIIDELSLMINETPANKLPVMFMNSEEQAMSEEQKTIEIQKKQIEDLTNQKSSLEAQLSESSDMSKKEKKETQSQIDKLTDNITNLTDMMTSTPEYKSTQAAKKREEIMNYLRTSEDEKDKELYETLSKPPDGDPDNNDNPQNHQYQQKSSKDVYVDPMEMIKKQCEGKTMKEMPEELRKKINEINADSRLHPMDKVRKVEQEAKKYNFV